MERLQIILVGSDSNGYKKLKSCLKDLGGKVSATARSGAGAIELFEKHKPDLVLIDLDFSGDMSGVETARNIHDRFGFPVVFISDHCDGKTIDSSISAEPYDYIPRQIESDDLRKTLELAMQRHRTEEQLCFQKSFLSSIIDHSPHPMWISDSKGTLIKINQAALMLFQITEDDVLGKYNIYQDEILKTKGLTDLVRRVFDAGETVRFELDYDTGLINHLKLTKAVHLFLYVTIVPILDASGKVVNAVIQHVDLTASRKSQDTVKTLSSRHEALLASVPDIIMETNSRKVYTWGNKAGLDFFGNDAIGKEAAYYFVGDQDTYEVVKPVFSGSEDVIYVESWQRRKDGQKRLLAWWCRTLKDIDGNVEGAVSTARDITDQKLAQDALEASEINHRSLFRNMREGLAHCRMEYVNDVPEDFVYLDVNPSFEELTGLKDVIGRKVSQVIPGIKQSDPEILNIYGRVASTGKPEKFEIFLKTLGIWFSVSAYSPRKGYFTAIFENITARKKAEEELRQRTEEINLFFACALDLLCIADTNGYFLKLNPEWTKTLGYSLEEMQGRRFLDFVHPDDIDSTIKTVSELTDQKPILNFSNRYRCKDGSYRWIEWRSFPVGKNIYASARDITEHKEAETRQELTIEILDILNRSTDRTDTIRMTVSAIKRRTGFSAVAMRIKDGDDFPFACQAGLSDEFIRDENLLCSRLPDGSIRHDESGKPVLECLCGLVLSGRTNPLSPIFSAGGSAWSNDSLQLLSLPSEKDPRVNPRNRCMHECFRSLALIPIRVNGQITGLLQLVDLNPNRFTPDIIRYFEGLAIVIGAAFARLLDADSIRETNERLDSAQKSASIGIWDWDTKTGKIIWSSKMFDLFGLDINNTTASFEAWRTAIHPDDLANAERNISKALEDHSSLNQDYRVILPGGQIRWINATGEGLYDDRGRPTRMIGVCMDITSRKLTEEKIRDSRNQFLAIVDAQDDLVCRWLPDLTLTFTNRRCREVIGLPEKSVSIRDWLHVVADDDRDVFFAKVQDIIANPRKLEAEYRFISVGGQTLCFNWVTTPLFDAQGKLVEFQSVGRDITASKQIEREREITIEILRLIHSHNQTHSLIQAVTRYLQELSGCEAVGIRLQDGDDYPYFETRGFPQEFVQAETYLCDRCPDGKPKLDGNGDPVLECMCGNVLRGRFDPSISFFTKKGSFWSNCTTDLLATTTDADRQTKTRNRCNSVGYESVALIAMKYSSKPIGLLQLNDRRKNRFTLEFIELLEQLSDSLAVALAQRQAEAAVRLNEKRYRSLFENMLNGFALHQIVLNDEGKPVDYIFLEVNESFELMTGLKAADIIGRPVREVLPGIEKEWIEIYGGVAITGKFIRFENYSRNLNKYFDVTAYSPEPGKFATIFIDISQRRQAEEMLKNQTQTLAAILESAPYVMMLVDNEGRVENINQTGANFCNRDRTDLINQLCGDVLKCFNSFNGLGCGQNKECSECPIRSRFTHTLRSGQGIYNAQGRMKVIRSGRQVELDLSISTALIKTSSGDKVLVSINDVTEDMRLGRITKARLDLLDYANTHSNDEILTAALDKIESITGSGFGFCHMINPDQKTIVSSNWSTNTPKLIHDPNDNHHDNSTILNDCIRDGRPVIHNDYSSIPRHKDSPENPSSVTREGAVPIFRDNRIVAVIGVGNKTFQYNDKDIEVISQLGDLCWEIIERKRAQDIIRIERNKLKAFFSSMPYGVYIVNAAYDVEYVNPILENEFGPVNGRKCHEYFHDRNESCPWCQNREVFAGKSVRWEWHSPKNDKTYDLFDTPIYNEDGSVSKLEIFVDITERKRAEEELRRSEEKFRILADFTYDWEYWIDDSGNFLYVSPSVERITGYKSQEFYDDPKLLDSIIVPEDREAVQNHINSDAPSSIEFRICHRDGRTLWIGHICQVVFSSDGNKLGRRASNRDITQRKLADIVLRESEEKFQKAFRSSPMIMTLSEIDTGRFIDVNDKFCELSGFSKNEAIGKTSIELGWISPKDRTKLVSQLKTQGRVIETELTLKAKNGRHILSLYSAEIVQLKERSVILSVTADITARKLVEEEKFRALSDLSRRTQELGALFRSASSILEGGEFHEIARKIFDAARELIGAKAGYIALLSKSGNENIVLFLESGDLPCSADPSLPMPIRGLRAEVYKSGRSAIANDFSNSPWVSLLPNGHVSLKNVMFTPLNIDGKTVGVMGLANKPEDFTSNDRNIAEAFSQLAAIALKNYRYLEAIKEDEERFRSLVESAPEAIFVQTDGKFVYVNPAMLRLIGATKPEELLGKSFFDVVAPEFHEIIHKRIQFQRETGKPAPMMEQVYLRFDGSRVSVETTAMPLQFQGKNSHLVFIHDVTDLKAAKEQERKRREEVIQAEKLAALGTLVAGVAHEISNPNQYIQMNAAIFKKAMSGILPVLDQYTKERGDFAIGATTYTGIRDQLPTLLEGMSEGSERIRRIVQELKDYVRLEPSDLKELFDINDAAEGAIRLLGATIRKSTHHFNKQLSTDLPRILGSKQRMEQVIVNLLNNALQALPNPEKSVSLKSYPDDGNIILEISDEGIGIPPENIQHLLEPFFTTKRETGGTGLGLPIADRIVREMGGKIVLQSEVGKGTIAKVLLPVHSHGDGFL